MNTLYDVCVIGGGASGMTAAIAAAEAGARVLILERLDRLGKKLLVTGNGRCNLSNTDIIRGQIPAQAYRGFCRSFPHQVLSAFDVNETYAFFGRLGLYTHTRDSYIYPMSDQAAAVADALRWRIAELKEIDVCLDCEVKGVRSGKARQGAPAFEITAANGTLYRSRRLILTAGGRAGVHAAADFCGYQIAEGLGHAVMTQVPALCPLKSTDPCFKTLAGIRLAGRVSLYHRGKAEKDWQLLAQDQGEIQLTANGLSGIPVFQVSRYGAYALADHREVMAELDLLPAMEEDRLLRYLKKQHKLHAGREMAMVLSGLFHKKLAALLAGRYEQFLKKGGREDSGDGALKALTRQIKHFRVPVTGTGDFREAQVTAGGLDVSQFDPETMASRRVPGLYAAGEVLDVDGICGGYNLQWAWASGYIAGSHAGRKA